MLRRFRCVQIFLKTVGLGQSLSRAGLCAVAVFRTTSPPLCVVVCHLYPHPADDAVAIFLISPASHFSWRVLATFSSSFLPRGHEPSRPNQNFPAPPFLTRRLLTLPGYQITFESRSSHSRRVGTPPFPHRLCFTPFFVLFCSLLFSPGCR